MTTGTWGSTHPAKVCAISSNNNYPKDGHVHFKRGQTFYVISANPRDKLYFVTTDLRTPFSRRALCGIAEMSLFKSLEGENIVYY